MPAPEFSPTRELGRPPARPLAVSGFAKFQFQLAAARPLNSVESRNCESAESEGRHPARPVTAGGSGSRQKSKESRVSAGYPRHAVCEQAGCQF